MTQVKIRLIGKTRLAVEEVLSHLQSTASVQGQKWSHHEGLDEWRLDATLALPASSQLPTSGSDGRPILVEDLDLPALTRNALRRCGVPTVEKLLETPEETLRVFPNVGQKGLQAIVDCLKRRGLYSSSALAKTWPD